MELTDKDKAKKKMSTSVDNSTENGDIVNNSPTYYDSKEVYNVKVLLQDGKQVIVQIHRDNSALDIARAFRKKYKLATTANLRLFGALQQARNILNLELQTRE